jgi:hypothetical protein
VLSVTARGKQAWRQALCTRIQKASGFYMTIDSPDFDPGLHELLAEDRALQMVIDK